MYERARFTVEHDGWTPEHWENRETIIRQGKAEESRANNLASIERQVTDLEMLFEMPRNGDLRRRVESLAPHVQEYERTG